jgi:toxin ParE1/3/4
VTPAVVFSPEAEADLLELYDYLVLIGDEARALSYIERIHASCVSLALAPERGTRRDDVRPGLRVTGFARRVTIAFHVGKDQVIIDRILYGGRDLKVSLDDQ